MSRQPSIDVEKPMSATQEYPYATFLNVLFPPLQLVDVLSLVDALGAVTPEAAAVWLTKMRQSTVQAPEPI